MIYIRDTSYAAALIEPIEEATWCHFSGAHSYATARCTILDNSSFFEGRHFDNVCLINY